ncbi:dnaJ homolog subfamily C member 1 [Spea bombifrons]|uniref:dnaJ homolog subfamily C member 1 n=1 Tax=Spea bombifrons TaxID=233779 RepID=UPI00234B7C4D|nr:dnaJ homolog subfamily C member 1 [Spea bombifrons]
MWLSVARLLLSALLLCPWQLPTVTAWDSGDLELFDLVEEIQQNFYQFLGVEQDASSADIRKAYRKVSLTLHPDKNKEENAETQFRQLVAIYEVLKDEERRKRYDDILVNGLPDWRQPVFYYRRVRKMSNAELALLLFIILTVGHYAVIWSIYLEKQLDELLSKKKKEKRKKAGGKTIDEGKSGLLEKNERVSEKPQWMDLLPFKLGIWFYHSVRSLPQLLQDAKDFYAEYKAKKIKEKEEAEAQAQLENILKEKKPKVKKPKSEFPVYPTTEASVNVQAYDQGVSIEEIEDQVDDWLSNRDRMAKKKSPEWTEEDLCQLTRSMVKFPGGTPGRWEKIAHELGRSVADVTSKAKQAKDSVSFSSGTVRLSDLKCTAKMSVNLSDSLITQREEEEPELEEQDFSLGQSEAPATARARKRKSAKVTDGAAAAARDEAEDKVRGRRQRDFDNEQEAEELVDSDDEIRKKEKSRALEDLWTQNQQKLLELALQQYPKGTAERWGKIAKCVPGKTKEECICRYKLLVELVQKKKQAKS